MIEKFLNILPQAVLPSRVFFSKKSLLYLKSLKGRTLFVYSNSVFKEFGEDITSRLGENVEIFCVNKASIEVIEEIKKLAKDCKNIVALGGGKVIDVTKVVARDLSLASVLIPTTNSAGSEASKYSLFFDESGKKVSISDDKLIKDSVVLLIPNYLASLSNERIKLFGLDALSHALEGFISKKSTFFSDSLARIVIKDLPKELLKQEHDLESLSKIQVLTFFAGIIQSMASVGITHSLAHGLEELKKVEHSKGIGLFLKEVLIFNKTDDETNKKLSSEEFKDLFNEIDSLCSGIKKGLVSLNLKDREELVTLSMNDVCSRTNPVMVKEEDFVKIIEKVFSNV